MMTGWYPHVRGHRTLWHLLRPDEPNLLRYLKQAGYQVQWFGKNDLLSQDSFAGSADVAERRGKGVFGKPAYPVDDPRYYSFLFDAYEGPLEEHGDYACVQAGIDFLRSKPKEPFILYLPLVFPHCPYSAPAHWHNAVDLEDLPPLRPAGLPNRPDFHSLIRRYRRLDELDEGEHEALMRKIQAVYLGMTGFIDELLGRLLNTLEDAGLAGSTTVSFFSDHGDYAGDYGLVEKWPSACEDIITRVPLVVRTPGGKAGHVVDEPVELFDIMATTLEQAEHRSAAYALRPQLRRPASGRPATRNASPTRRAATRATSPTASKACLRATSLRATKPTSITPKAHSSKTIPTASVAWSPCAPRRIATSSGPRGYANCTICKQTLRNCIIYGATRPTAPYSSRWRVRCCAGWCRQATSPPSTQIRAG